MGRAEPLICTPPDGFEDRRIPPGLRWGRLVLILILILVGPVALASGTVGYPGANLSISADGSSDGIVWGLEHSGTRTVPGVVVLHAYNAANVGQELYNSNQAGTRDQPGHAVKFAVPTIANGKVYVGTQTGLTVYGLPSIPQL